jgi:hypothetical protein
MVPPTGRKRLWLTGYQPETDDLQQTIEEALINATLVEGDAAACDNIDAAAACHANAAGPIPRIT